MCLVLQNWYTACMSFVLYTSEVHKSFVTQCDCIDMSAAYLANVHEDVIILVAKICNYCFQDKDPLTHTLTYSIYIEAGNLPFPCCSGCPADGFAGATDHARSCQGHLVSSSRPLWTDQPSVHHSV